MPTSISRAWNDALMSNSTTIENVDDRHNEGHIDTRERLLNGGHKVTTSSISLTDGIHKVASTNYDSNEWNVYSSSEATKLLQCTDTAVTINASGGLVATLITGTTIAAGTTLTLGGVGVVTQTYKRILTLCATGNSPSAGGTTPDINTVAMLVPKINGASITGTITEISGFLFNGTGGTRVVSASKRPGTFADEVITGLGAPTILFSASVSLGAGTFGFRVNSGTVPTLTNNTVTSSDYIIVGPSTGAEVGWQMTVTILLDF